MIQIITNEEELENVVGGIKAKHVVRTTLGILTGAALVAAGKFSYDVYDEYQTKTNANQDMGGFIKAVGSYTEDWADENHIKSKSPYRRLVTKTTYGVAKVINNVREVMDGID